MDRREAVKYISMLLGGTVVGSSFFLSGCKANDDKVSMQFTDADIAFLDEVAETILPRTSTPGAKDAAVGKFMTVMVNDCYEKEDQEVFHKGMKQLKDIAKEKMGDTFMKLPADKKQELLIQLDKEQKEFQEKKKPEERSHYFRMMKELTLLGFFTSEPGATQALRYIERPGRYDGCVPYKKGDKAWA